MKKEKEIDFESIIKENEQLKIENRKLHQFVSFMEKQILDFKSELAQYYDALESQRQFELRQAYLESDNGIVGKFMIKIENLNLSARTYNILKGANCNTLGDIASLKKTDLIKFRGFGKNKFQEVEKVLVFYGLDFEMDVKSIIEEALNGWQPPKKCV